MRDLRRFQALRWLLCPTDGLFCSVQVRDRLNGGGTEAIVYHHVPAPPPPLPSPPSLPPSPPLPPEAPLPLPLPPLPLEPPLPLPLPEPLPASAVCARYAGRRTSRSCRVSATGSCAVVTCCWYAVAWRGYIWHPETANSVIRSRICIIIAGMSVPLLSSPACRAAALNRAIPCEAVP